MAERRLPNDVELIAGIALIDRRQGRFARALQGLERVLRLDPRNASWMWEAGITLQVMRRYADAEWYFETSISLAPDQVTAYMLRAQALVSGKGSIEGARASLERMPRKGRLYAAAWGWLETLARDFSAAQAQMALRPAPAIASPQRFRWWPVDQSSGLHPPTPGP